MDRAALAEWVWHDAGPVAAAARAALSPAAWAFGVGVARRNGQYDQDRGVLPVTVPALSVGNLTVGGTGKTPVAAWCAAQLAAAGARPAIVLRGYGDDEWRVHQLLSPAMPVIVQQDRVAGIREAAGQGADVAVLDDAFQHRRAQRVADLVLVSADRWTGRTRLLPAGPWREPLASLRRATVAVVTVKAAALDRVEAVCAAIRRVAPDLPLAVVGIAPGYLQRVMLPEEVGAADQEPMVAIAGERVGVVSAIGDPTAFEAQLAAVGARPDARRFPDHHAYTGGDVSALLAHWDRGSRVTRVVCTLKDAVKLASRWPRAAPPLWYVSQTIEVRLGSDALQSALRQVLAARTPPHAASLPTAG